MSELDFERYYQYTKDDYLCGCDKIKEHAAHWFKKRVKCFEASKNYATLITMSSGLTINELEYFRLEGWELISHSCYSLIIMFSFDEYYFKKVVKK